MLYTDEFVAAEVAYRREQLGAAYQPKSSRRSARPARPARHHWREALVNSFDRPRRVATHI